MRKTTAKQGHLDRGVAPKATKTEYAPIEGIKELVHEARVRHEQKTIAALSPETQAAQRRMGCNLKRLRIKHGMTQDQLASLSDVDSKYISAIERGARGAGRKTLAKFCEVFKVSEDQIRNGSADTPDHIKLIHAEVDKALSGKDISEQFSLAGEILKVLKEYRQAA